MTRVYYREAVGAFIVFDVTRPASFEAVTKWKEDLDSKLTLANGKHVATVLLANKCDQGRDVLTNNGIKMEQFCQENGFAGWYETSAKVRDISSWLQLVMNSFLSAELHTASVYSVFAYEWSLSKLF